MAVTQFIDLSGQRFGFWTALRFTRRRKKHTLWLCRCDCGIVREVIAWNLRSGTSVSCGCQATRLSNEKNVVHGMSGTPTWRAWQSMLSRCRNKNNREYKNYGERGIRVCERWDLFENFLTDMGIRPTEIKGGRSNYTLDRIDNNGHYEPGNCRWATVRDQQRNKRCNIRIEFNGETLCLAEWAELYALKYHVVLCRYYSGVCPPALFAPVKRRHVA